MPVLVVPYGKTSIFRKYQNRYLREYADNVTAKTILNLGATPDAPDKEGRTYEQYFPDSEFFTLDLGPSDHQRHLQADLMAMPENAKQYDLVLAMSVIEHIDRPWVAANNIVRLIKPGGHLYVAMPFFYPVHEGPYYGDHWRASPSAMQYLFEGLVPVRCDYYPSSILAVRDRAQYWSQTHSSYAGFSMLMSRPT